MKVFCSGSCRLLSTIRNTYDIETIHSLEEPHFKGINFLGKFHDTKSHIQFIEFIKGNLELDDENLKLFFTSYNSDKWECMRFFEPKSTIPLKLYNLKKNIDNCDAYIFEICSVKTYKYKGAYCQFEQKPDNDISQYEINIQDEKELLEDLNVIRSFFPEKKIIFQCHFRPNIIYNDETKKIEKRELIYKTITKFCNENINCFLYDPSILLQEKKWLFDGDSHFNGNGLNESFNFLYNNFLVSTNKPI
jgi:hypothetical protein